MSTRERGMQTRISGHTGADGGAMDAQTGPLSTNGQSSRSMAELLRELSTESGDLVRQEVDLAKAEMREKIEIFQRGMMSIGIGSALLLAALLTALWALNTGLTTVLANMMGLDVALWLSPLILTAVLGGIGMAMIKGASARMSQEGLSPKRTTQSLKEDGRWARAKAHEVKEEMTHGQ